jgi:recombination protein RecA
MTGLLKLKDDVVKKYGGESVMFANDIPVRAPVSTGSLALDFATGIGGFPPDRVIEVAGADSCGKTTLGLYTMMSFLDAQPDRGALILDTEHKLTMSWVEQLIGPDRMKRVLLAWPDHMEQATNMYTDLVSSGQICMVLFDSIGGSPTKWAAEEDAEKADVGGNSRPVTRFAHLAAVYSQKYGCLTFGVNQVRAMMGARIPGLTDTPGGYAWKHHCILRLRLKRGTFKVSATVNGEDMQVGYNVVAKVIKNQLAAEGRTAWWWMYNVPTEEYGFGIDTLDEIIRLAVLTNVITQHGAWYHHDGLPDGKVKSKNQLTEAIQSNEPLRIAVVEQTMGVLRNNGELGAQVAPISDPDEEIREPTNIASIFRQPVE